MHLPVIQSWLSRVRRVPWILTCDRLRPVADPDGPGPLKGTDIAIFQPDLDPSTTTDPLDDDSDGDGVLDGEEDQDHNGRQDPGETDPNQVNIRALQHFLLLLLR